MRMLARHYSMGTPMKDEEEKKEKEKQMNIAYLTKVTRNTLQQCMHTVFVMGYPLEKQLNRAVTIVDWINVKVVI